MCAQSCLGRSLSPGNVFVFMASAWGEGSEVIPETLRISHASRASLNQLQEKHLELLGENLSQGTQGVLRTSPKRRNQKHVLYGHELAPVHF